MVRKSKSKMLSGYEEVKQEDLFQLSLSTNKRNKIYTSSMWSGLTKNRGADNSLTIYRHRS